MKPILHLLISLLVATQLTASTTVAEYTYTIHIGAFVRAQLADFSNIQSYGYLYSESLNNLQQIYMGNYANETEAQQVLAKVKRSGYPDAFVTRRNLDNGNTLTVIQLGTQPAGEAINWSKYVKAGPLHAMPSATAVKIMTGPFQDIDEARMNLGVIRQLGFKDAFMKNVNSTLLHPVQEFETGGSVVLRNSPDRSLIPAPEPETTVATPPVTTPSTPPATDFVPQSYEDVGLRPKSPSVPVAKVAQPNIRKNVKRTSVLELQKVLKTKGSYRSSLDGLYGPGTTKAYNNLMTENEMVRRYEVLRSTGLVKPAYGAASQVQQAIDDLLTESTTSLADLEAAKTPIADAYRAYWYFTNQGPGSQVNQLMNGAIKAAFTNKRLENKPPFDYQANYAYQDLGQLLQHIRYIHDVTGYRVAVPVWIFEQHRAEAQRIFKPSGELTGAGYRLTDFGQRLDWESLQLLETMAFDLAGSKINETQMLMQQSERSRWLLNAKALSTDDYKRIDLWNTRLWQGVSTWENADPMHARIGTALRLGYFKSWALLEDYFMNQGFSAREARGLSLCVLRTYVEPQLARFAK